MFVNSAITTNKTTNFEISKKIKSNDQQSFVNILSDFSKAKEKIDEEDYYVLDFDSKPVEDLEEIFDFNLEEEKDKFIKDNGKINIVDIIQQYGANVSGNEIRDFGQIINTLYNSGALDTDDYFYAMKWITIKQMECSTKFEIDQKIHDEVVRLRK